MTPKSCSDCEHHETIAEKTTTMWAGWRVLAWVSLLVIPLLLWTYNSDKAAAEEERDANRALGLDNAAKIASMYKLGMETNLNLKHLLKAQGVEYEEISDVK